MKHYPSFLIFLLLLLACESQLHNTPKETVIAYITASNQFDSQEVENLLVLNSESKIKLETLKKMEKSIPDERKTEFKDRYKDAVYYEKEITDSTAIIVVTPKDNVTLPIEFDLKKIKTKWLIESIIYH